VALVGKKVAQLLKLRGAFVSWIINNEKKRGLMLRGRIENQLKKLSIQFKLEIQ
jgi:hypothetical protein